MAAEKLVMVTVRGNMAAGSMKQRTLISLSSLIGSSGRRDGVTWPLLAAGMLMAVYLGRLTTAAAAARLSAS